MRVKAVLPLLAVAGLLFASACSVDLTKSSVQTGVVPLTPTPTVTPSGPGPAEQGARAAAFHKWGLPLLAPPPPAPAVKPVKTGGFGAAGQVPVVRRIPTNQKIVFLTFDDGVEKDPQFVRMMSDLKVPFSMFLADQFIKDDYRYFKPLQALGNSIENHTVNHPDLVTLPPVAQQREICGQQQLLTRAYGVTPGLFRPPFGTWNAATRAAVKACGLRAIIMWSEFMGIDRVAFPPGVRRFQPGDIILAHFRTPAQLGGRALTTMTGNLLKEIAAQGYTVARLEDYV